MVIEVELRVKEGIEVGTVDIAPPHLEITSLVAVISIPFKACVAS